MTRRPTRPNAAFTLVEVLVGASLSLIVMSAVLSSYVFLGRNFTRSLGLSGSNQPSLESQGRRTLASFTQDIRMSSGISGTPSVSSLTLTLPTASGTTTVSYVYDSVAATLTRTPASGTAQVLHTNLLSFYFRYYDATNNPFDNSAAPYTTVANYLTGIKQVSITFSSQAGSSVNGTLTQIYRGASPRLLLRNKSWQE